MSMKTCAESTLISSTGKRSASAIDTAVLPEAVGPMIRMALGWRCGFMAANAIMAGCGLQATQQPVAQSGQQNHPEQDDEDGGVLVDRALNGQRGFGPGSGDDLRRRQANDERNA